ncbi:hypothetical protein P7C73_g4089, partial [Tremellales sp. Uapishka_1]
MNAPPGVDSDGSDPESECFSPTAAHPKTKPSFSLKSLISDVKLTLPTRRRKKKTGDQLDDMKMMTPVQAVEADPPAPIPVPGKKKVRIMAEGEEHPDTLEGLAMGPEAKLITDQLLKQADQADEREERPPDQLTGEVLTLLRRLIAERAEKEGRADATPLASKSDASSSGRKNDDRKGLKPGEKPTNLVVVNQDPEGPQEKAEKMDGTVYEDPPRRPKSGRPAQAECLVPISPSPVIPPGPPSVPAYATTFPARDEAGAASAPLPATNSQTQTCAPHHPPQYVYYIPYPCSPLPLPNPASPDTPNSHSSPQTHGLNASYYEGYLPPSPYPHSDHATQSNNLQNPLQQWSPHNPTSPGNLQVAVPPWHPQSPIPTWLPNAHLPLYAYPPQYPHPQILQPYHPFYPAPPSSTNTPPLVNPWKELRGRDTPSPGGLQLKLSPPSKTVPMPEVQSLKSSCGELGDTGGPTRDPELFQGGPIATNQERAIDQEQSKTVGRETEDSTEASSRDLGNEDHHDKNPKSQSKEDEERRRRRWEKERLGLMQEETLRKELQRMKAKSSSESPAAKAEKIRAVEEWENQERKRDQTAPTDKQLMETSGDDTQWLNGNPTEKERDEREKQTPMLLEQDQRRKAKNEDELRRPVVKDSRKLRSSDDTLLDVARKAEAPTDDDRERRKKEKVKLLLADRARREERSALLGAEAAVTTPAAPKPGSPVVGQSATNPKNDEETEYLGAKTTARHPAAERNKPTASGRSERHTSVEGDLQEMQRRDRAPPRAERSSRKEMKGSEKNTEEDPESVNMVASGETRMDNIIRQAERDAEMEYLEEEARRKADPLRRKILVAADAEKEKERQRRAPHEKGNLVAVAAEKALRDLERAEGRRRTSDKMEKAKQNVRGEDDKRRAQVEKDTTKRGSDPRYCRASHNLDFELTARSSVPLPVEHTSWSRCLVSLATCIDLTNTLLSDLMTSQTGKRGSHVSPILLDVLPPLLQSLLTQQDIMSTMKGVFGDRQPQAMADFGHHLTVIEKYLQKLNRHSGENAEPSLLRSVQRDSSLSFQTGSVHAIVDHILDVAEYLTPSILASLENVMEMWRKDGFTFRTMIHTIHIIQKALHGANALESAAIPSRQRGIQYLLEKLLSAITTRPTDNESLSQSPSTSRPSSVTPGVTAEPRQKTRQQRNPPKVEKDDDRHPPIKDPHLAHLPELTQAFLEATPSFPVSEEANPTLTKERQETSGPTTVLTETREDDNRHPHLPELTQAFLDGKQVGPAERRLRDIRSGTASPLTHDEAEEVESDEDAAELLRFADSAPAARPEGVDETDLDDGPEHVPDADEVRRAKQVMVYAPDKPAKVHRG